MSGDPFDYAPAGALRAAEVELKRWTDNVSYMLEDGDPDVIFSREDAAKVDLVQSLVLTLNRTRHSRDRAMGFGKPEVAEDVVAEAIDTTPSPELQADFARYREIKTAQHTRLLTELVAETALHGQWHNATVRETLRAGVYSYNRLGNRTVTNAFGDDMVDAIVKRLIEAGWKPPR